MKLGGALNDLSVEALMGRGRFSACFSHGDHEWVPVLPRAVMSDGFILLLTVLLSSLVAAAQTGTPQTAPAQERVAPIITRFQTVLAPSPARSFVLSEDPRKSDGHSRYLYVRTYERDQDLENLSRIHRLKTLFLTQSSLPLFQLWGGRLLVDGFTSRLHMQNVQLGPPPVGGLQNLYSSRQGYPGGPRFYGLSLRFPVGRDTPIGRATETWRCFARLVGAPR